MLSFRKSGKKCINFIEVYLTYNIVRIIQIVILNPKKILVDYSLKET